MSRAFVFLTLLFSLALPAWAKSCAEYELTGKARYESDDVVLVVNEAGMSQRMFPFGIDLLARMAPYVGVSTRGRYLLSLHEKEGLKVERILEVKRLPPELMASGGIKKLRDAPCDLR